MSSADMVRHFFTGVWVFIFGLVAIPFALIYWGVISVGDLFDNPVVLLVLGIFYLIIAFVISGWAARNAVKRVL